MLSNSEPKPDSSPRNKALDLLSRREHSAAELRVKLVARNFDHDAITIAIDDLVKDNLVSDDRFAAGFVASRLRKGRGPIRIRGELRQRGVADELIVIHLQQADVDWCQLARSVRDRKFGAAGSMTYREQARQSRFLQHRGFSGEQIRAALGDRHMGGDDVVDDDT